ncbi:Uncharacterised protein [Vibrio cholerae]|nr:Uncharacterised protein [Vibrio cholerae]
MAWVHETDIFIENLHFCLLHTVLRHNDHQVLCRLQYCPKGIDTQLLHSAVNGRADDFELLTLTNLRKFLI